MTAINVGRSGGDLAARRFALAMTVALTILPLPSLELSPSTLKLVSLAVAMSGTVLLMAGLVFLQKTHYAGIMLIPSACAVMAATQMGSRFGASFIGLLFSAAIIWSFRTGRCEINELLGLDSRDQNAPTVLKKGNPR